MWTRCKNSVIYFVNPRRRGFEKVSEKILKVLKVSLSPVLTHIFWFNNCETNQMKFKKKLKQNYFRVKVWNFYQTFVVTLEGCGVPKEEQKCAKIRQCVNELWTDERSQNKKKKESSSFSIHEEKESNQFWLFSSSLSVKSAAIWALVAQHKATLRSLLKCSPVFLV